MRELSSAAHVDLTAAVQDRDMNATESATAEARPVDPGDLIAPGLHALERLFVSNSHEVFLAWDDERYTVVAVKLALPHLTGDERIRRSLAAEAALLQRLDHPVLPRCFGVDVDGDRPYVSLEYVEGPRLSTVIRRQRFLGVEQAVPLLQQVTAALHYLHGKGLVHLDVKSKNVIMAPPPRLIDLSVARSIDEARRLDQPVGTDAYMAPEQADPRLAPTIGPATDVWGLGVTLHEALSGHRPFPAGDRTATGAARFPQLASAPTTLPKHVPADLAALVRATLERRPQDRPSAADVADALDPVIASAPRKLLLGKFRVSTWKPART
jgi:serine/threonine protein kinase